MYYKMILFVLTEFSTTHKNQSMRFSNRIIGKWVNEWMNEWVSEWVRERERERERESEWASEGERERRVGDIGIAVIYSTLLFNA